MEKAKYSGIMCKVELLFILISASVLAFMLYHFIIDPRTTTYGVSDDINISVEVEPNLFGLPKIDDIGPISGPVGGGTLLTITGKYLNGVTEISLGDGLKCEPITHISPEKITCTMPPHERGYIDVTIISPGYGTDTKNNGFRYVDNNLPGVPNTGLFRLGQYIVTLYDVLIFVFLGAAGAIFLWFVVLKQIRRRETSKRI